MQKLKYSRITEQENIKLLLMKGLPWKKCYWKSREYFNDCITRRKQISCHPQTKSICT